MTKYRLKKDTPFYKKGTEFSEDLCHKGELLNDDCLPVANLNELDNPDEWFEEAKESDWWKPKFNEEYYFSNNLGELGIAPWSNDELDKARYSMGNVFKTKEAAKRYRDYLRAVATVRQDEGVLTPEQIYELGRNNGEAYHIGCTDKQNGEEVLSVCEMDLYFWPPVGVILFDTEKHAQASLDKHLDEWRTITNYDWSKE